MNQFSLNTEAISRADLSMRNNRKKRLQSYLKQSCALKDTTATYLKRSQPKVKTSLFAVWTGFDLSKKVVLSAIIFSLIFLPILNTPQAQAGVDIDSMYLTEEDYLATSPVGTASVKTEIELYTAQEGDSIGSLAQKYNVSSFTIAQANGLAWDAQLKVGQELKIPPVSGILHTVVKGDTVSTIASKYSVTKEVVLYQNGMLPEDTLVVGAELIVPNGVMPAPVRDTNTSTGRANDTSWQPSASQLPSIDAAGTLVKPSNSCRYTQYYHYGHYAIDCAAPIGTPLYAADGGTVSKVSTGTWGGGYGNHVIIDHGNGMKTLYGHMNVVYVTEGQYVGRGDNIGTMGSTGRSTGPHVHFEVIKNGVKQNPLDYF